VSEESDSLAARYLPNLPRARAQGLSVPAPFGLLLRGTTNLLDAEPTRSLPLAVIQTTGQITHRRGGLLVTEPHDCTHVGPELASLELALRREVVAFRSQAPWPAALRISLLTTTAAAGAYREAPVERRRTFEGFDCHEAFRNARRRTQDDPAVEAHVIPVLLLAYRGLSWRRTVALLALSGAVTILPPWAD
jgi:hypothetical protein